MPTVDITPPRICDLLALPPLPFLPPGISIAAVAPGIGTAMNVRLCCKTLFFDALTVTPPISLGAGVLLPLVPAINQVIAAINLYKRLLPIRCPREPSIAITP